MVRYLTDISSKNILDVFGLEFSLDNQTGTAVNRSGTSDLSESELLHVVWCSVHTRDFSIFFHK
jgi:hypothetical protein